MRWTVALTLNLLLLGVLLAGGCAYSSSDRQYEPSGNMRQPETERYPGYDVGSNRRGWGRYYDANPEVAPDRY